MDDIITEGDGVTRSFTNDFRVINSVKVSDLPQISTKSIDDNDLFYIVDHTGDKSKSRKIPFGILKSEIWGGIDSRKIDRTSLVVFPNNINEARMTMGLGIKTNLILSKSDVVIDWGDHTATILRREELERDNDSYLIDHTYEQQGYYRINIFGSRYYGLKGIHDKNIIYRLMDYDLPLASNCYDISYLCNGSKELTNVRIPNGFVFPSNQLNIEGLFQGCINLQEVRWDPALLSVYSLGRVFKGCTNLRNVYWKCPMSSGNKYNEVYSGCENLVTPVINLIPTGFTQNNVNTSYMFNNCKQLSDSGLFNKSGAHGLLWNDHSRYWNSNIYNFNFDGCSDLIRCNIPESWGGTAKNLFTYNDGLTEIRFRNVAYKDFIIQNNEYNYFNGEFIPSLMKRNVYFENWNELSPKFNVFIDTSLRKLDNQYVQQYQTNDNNAVELVLPENCVFSGNPSLLSGNSLTFRSSTLLQVKYFNGKVYIMQIMGSINLNSADDDFVALLPEALY